MDSMIRTLVNCLDHAALEGTQFIPWSCPVLSFGNLSTSRIATLGLNPSNREFVDTLGNELDGKSRRFHTLKSLGLSRWTDANVRHLKLIVESNWQYFRRNPYDGWFRQLDQIISGTKSSYYGASASACHLDLIPFATKCKWVDLTTRERSSLFTASGDALAYLLRNSPVRLLVLNGNSVVRQFQKMADVHLQKQTVEEWSLSRGTLSEVKGIAYKGVVRTLWGVDLEHDLLVVGFNHNIQSSFGVTKDVVGAIRRWVAKCANEAAK